MNTTVASVALLMSIAMVLFICMLSALSGGGVVLGITTNAKEDPAISITVQREAFDTYTITSNTAKVIDLGLIRNIDALNKRPDKFNMHFTGDTVNASSKASFDVNSKNTLYMDFDGKVVQGKLEISLV
ncbi:hypothetical protein EB118_08800 [bacterium]|nr:hypothetical protein [bacterium]NDC94662.1 hypothetical protein [bacterium]NDD84304.1 hypothetical protein [bacterium]NDG30160.1 hypothetical protein [bacterium]